MMCNTRSSLTDHLPYEVWGHLGQSGGVAEMMQGNSGAARSISNEELTELTLNSAIELDRKLHAQQANEAVVDDFLKALEKLVNVDRDQTTRMLVSDPRKVGFVNRAFRYINRDTPTIQALISSINIISEDYRRPSPLREDVERLRNFCIALHKELLAHAYGGSESERSREGISKNAARLL
jgi:hypothetical protein